MTTAHLPSISVIDLFLVLGGALLILVAQFGLRAGLRLVTMSRTSRERLDRFLPVFELLVWVVYLPTSLAWLMGGHPLTTLIIVCLLGAMLIFAGWFAFRDYIAGVVLRSERGWQRGDWVQSGEVEGRIRHLGLRTLQIERADGDRVLIPYGRLSREALVQGIRVSAGAAHHTFAVGLEDPAREDEVRRAIEQTALLCHWSAPRPEPEVRTNDVGQLEVTIHALTEERAATVERVVRAAVSALDAQPRSHGAEG